MIISTNKAIDITVLNDFKTSQAYNLNRMDEAIKRLNNAAAEFIRVADSVMLSKQVYELGWNAKEIIAHIVFYHEYYARVVEAIVQKQELPLINESLARVNKRSAKEESKYSREILLSRFKTAHEIFVKNLIQLDSSARIPYKENGRIYEVNGYINEITRHIMRHTKDLKRKKRGKLER
jgi:hypothetical protein